jgi:hypothetical protein
MPSRRFTIGGILSRGAGFLSLYVSGVGPAPAPVIFTRGADASVRGDLNDGLDSPSSVAGAPQGRKEIARGKAR